MLSAVAQGGGAQQEAAGPRRIAVPADGAARTASGGNGGSARRSRAWASVLHVNGVAVYVEEQDADGEGGAIMVRGGRSAGAACVTRCEYSKGDLRAIG